MLPVPPPQGLTAKQEHEGVATSGQNIFLQRIHVESVPKHHNQVDIQLTLPANMLKIPILKSVKVYRSYCIRITTTSRVYVISLHQPCRAHYSDKCMTQMYLLAEN